MTFSKSSEKAKTSSSQIYRLARLSIGLPECHGGAVPRLQGLRRRGRPVRSSSRVGARRLLPEGVRSGVSAYHSRPGQPRSEEARLVRNARADAPTDGCTRAEDPRGGARRHRPRSHLKSRRLSPLASLRSFHVSSSQRLGSLSRREGRAREERPESPFQETYAARESARCQEHRHCSSTTTTTGKKTLM